MKLFFKRLGLFSIPLVIYCIIVIIIDPYDYFFHKNFIPDDIKIKVINRSPKSMPRGNTLWKYNHFNKHPCDKIIIGDSRAFDLNVKEIEQITGEDYFNFGVPGGNYNSIFETFWFAAKKINLKKVYIQTTFHTYSTHNKYNLMSEAREIRTYPYLFFTKFYFFEESLLDVKYLLFSPKEEKIKFDEKNWNKVLDLQGDVALSQLKYSEEYFNKLKEITEYCKKNNIELNFIIFPDHKEFHELIVKRQHQKDYLKYKKDIYSFGNKVYDFDVENSPIASDRNNYRDAFHLQVKVIDSYILTNIWGHSASGNQNQKEIGKLNK